MVTKLVYNNKAFKMLGDYCWKSSSNEVTFNDITIDFTNCSIADIPFKYQEIQIRQAKTEDDILTNYIVLFTGYLDEINLSEMKTRKEYREMTLTLLSPLKMATKRNVSLIGTYELNIAIRRVMQPLLDDGFIIKELNVKNGLITTNFVIETVEDCMNKICFKRNIFWYINENKEIFINSIDYLFTLPAVKKIHQNKKEEGLFTIQPTIENINYANVINFKNVRLIYTYWSDESTLKSEYPIISEGKQFKKGDIVNFNYPVIVDEERLNSIIKEYNDKDNPSTIERYYYSIFIEFSNNDYVAIGRTKEGLYGTNGNVNFSDDKIESDVVLQRDSFYSNLITGFKWNKDETVTITKIRTDTALRYTTMRFMHSEEINRLKGLISKSGQIEKTIDYAEKWTSLQQLINYAKSLMIQNSKTVNQVKLGYDSNPNLKIGDIVEINEPDFFIQGRFAVKDISYTFHNEIDQIWEITLKNSNLISTYIDMFRPQEIQENQENINTVILSEFVEEQISEKHYLELEQSEHTLDFNL